MKVFFSADCHFDHANILEYCKRPFKDIDHMNSEIVRRWNDVVSKDDLVYHIGDFAFKGILNGRRFEKMLNGTIVHFMGNHDRNNGIKTYITKGMMEFGNKEVFVQHNPPEIIPICDFCICGHVHEKWLFKFIKKHPNTPVINVGMDVHQFTPVSTNSLLSLYDDIMYHYKGKNNYGQYKREDLK